ncbi:MAG: ANTAR domain-containing protein [Candidatus Margulisbacteria bacterium]|nr:ANTAR domain-containing protein [Candidatus Margulisiibacteriota bacterium]
MLNSRQQEIIDILSGQSGLPSAELRQKLGLTRARLNQLIAPLIKKQLVKKAGAARATVYRLTDKRSQGQIRRENWELRQKVKQLEKTLEDRKVIERAKEVLIAQFDILPTEAYRKLQEQSMDSGRPMREVAERIVSAFEI